MWNKAWNLPSITVLSYCGFEHLCPEMNIIRCMLNVHVNVTKCSFKSKRKPLICSFRVSACVGFFFQAGFCVTAFRLFEEQNSEDTLWPCLPLFLVKSDGEVNEKGERTLCYPYIEVGIPLHEYICGLIWVWNGTISPLLRHFTKQVRTREI